MQDIINLFQIRQVYKEEGKFSMIVSVDNLIQTLLINLNTKENEKNDKTNTQEDGI
jgi:hypothetical protein